MTCGCKVWSGTTNSLSSAINKSHGGSEKADFYFLPNGLVETFLRVFKIIKVD